MTIRTFFDKLLKRENRVRATEVHEAKKFSSVIENNRYNISKLEKISTPGEVELSERQYKIIDKSNGLMFEMALTEKFNDIEKKGAIDVSLTCANDEIKDCFNFDYQAELPEAGDKKFSLRKGFVHSLKMRVQNQNDGHAKGSDRSRNGRRTEEQVAVDARNASILLGVIHLVGDDVVQKSEIVKQQQNIKRETRVEEEKQRQKRGQELLQATDEQRKEQAQKLLAKSNLYRAVVRAVAIRSGRK